MNVLRNLSLVALAIGTSIAGIGASYAEDAQTPSMLNGSPNAQPLPEATLSFARKNIWNWEADGQKGIWVETIGHQWYYAKFLSPCIDLPFRIGVRFRFGPSGELDKFGAIIVPHYPECSFISFTRSDGPPTKAKKPQPVTPAPAAPSTSPSPAAAT